jgi:hypothetical protein
MTLIEFLTARLDEEERMARDATGGPWEVGPTFGAHDSRVYVQPAGDGIDTIGTCVIAGQVANMPEFRANRAGGHPREEPHGVDPLVLRCPARAAVRHPPGLPRRVARVTAVAYRIDG